MATRSSKHSSTPAKRSSRPAVKRTPSTETTTGADPGDNETLARTVIYVHGIGPKPAEAVLTCQWDRALFGHLMGDRTRMAYWVNHARHGWPVEAECDDGDSSVSASAVRQFGALEADWDPRHERLIEHLSTSKEERDFLREMRDNLEEQAAPGSFGAKGVSSAFWNSLSWLFTRAFIRDTHDFFFDQDARTRMRESLMDVLKPGGAPFVVIGHSQGSMIAYDVLRELDPSTYPVDLFLTIGSPLGLNTARARFRKWTGSKRLPFPPCVSRWLNVANRGDIVCADLDLTNDIQKTPRFQNIIISSPNQELKDDKHAATGYLQVAEVRQAVTEATGPGFVQPVGPQTIMSDLDREMKGRPRTATHPVLIELGIKRFASPAEIGEMRAALDRRIRDLVQTRPDPDAREPCVETMRYWLSAQLTRSEVETLRTEFAELSIRRIWKDAQKHALINVSSAMVQANVANAAYSARGQGITWAVLDTGIRADHPHFQTHDTVKAVWDCTGRGEPTELALTGKNLRALDPQGHGTHVAGIIAGHLEVAEAPDDEPRVFAGLAPEAKLIGFKVLDEAGNGRDSWIIKALDKIAEINEAAGNPVIHGVNLSLGGYFDPSVYGCGHTPLCRELKRLWRQGVVVVIAAGNEGYTVLRTSGGSSWPSNMDISIGDPANLEEAIAVGSVHRKNPHTYGVSYFSSRGPTADGRNKPDLVAPGEKILSARHIWAPINNMQIRARDLYVEMSGTSMAAPHVSGLLAAFLSARAEFKGEPDRVKKRLLDSCIDLHRDAHVQGQGLPNLVAMLATT
ncbi:MAG TPA: S8 family peptidase [Anaerolineae bacterium]|nr:S8 family peptidase [Anaerolineae bacterium]